MTGRVYFGKSKTTGESIYLKNPSWDCNWYWSLGYLGNKNRHYHLKDYAAGRNINMHEALKEDYDLCPSLMNDKNLCTFCELFLSAYTMKKAAEVFGRGGSHMSSNPASEAIKNESIVRDINERVLPAIFAEIDKLFTDTPANQVE